MVAAESVLAGAALTEGGGLRVTGQIRTFNSRGEGGRKLVISVFAEQLDVCDGEPENDVTLSGALCKPPVLRRTPLGRDICDIMLAVPRKYHRTDYVPCILWGRTAQEVSVCHTRDCIRIYGRLQSRIYTKLTEDGLHERTAYEISALSAEILEQQI